MENDRMMNFSPEDVAALRELLEESKGDTLEFKGAPMIRRYAEYLLEYLEAELGFRAWDAQAEAFAALHKGER